jgi:hypothetical protein
MGPGENQSTKAKAHAGPSDAVTTEDITHAAAELGDADVAAILALGATKAEFEQALMYAEGLGDLVDRAGHPAIGKVALIVEILAQSQEWQDRDR